MLLIDSSCWIDFLRGSPTRARDDMRVILANRLSDVAVCEPVAMELLACTSQPSTIRSIEALLGNLVDLPVDVNTDFRAAAAIQQALRREGNAARSMIDCLIAAIALRHDVEVVHKDADFDRIAGVTKLKVRALH